MKNKKVKWKINKINPNNLPWFEATESDLKVVATYWFDQETIDRLKELVEAKLIQDLLVNAIHQTQKENEDSRPINPYRN
jgi:hypothetical protein